MPVVFFAEHVQNFATAAGTGIFLASITVAKSGNTTRSGN
jgi:hypothetical protein